MRYGYARVSSVDQDLSIQIEALEAAGCEVRKEKASGTKLDGRSELQLLMEFMRKGDELYVTRIDRLARSIADLQSYRGSIEREGCRPQSDRAADRHLNGRRQSVPRHAWRVCRIRDEPPS